MILARGPVRALEAAQLRWTDAGEPHSTRYDDCYFSAERGDAETRHVFLDGSDLSRRLQAFDGRCFRVAELGFGTGLNFLLTWQLFEQHAQAHQRLHFWSIDRHPLSRDSLQQALERWPALQAVGAELLAAYPPPLPGVHRRLFLKGRVQLDMVWAEAGDALADLASFDQPQIDAWYLDGFAPSRNASMWAPQLFQQMSSASRDGASVATYSAAGAVRRGLENAGFDVRKHAGFGSKRECLRGRLRRRETAPVPTLTPWDLPARRSSGCDQALVLGAGLAGAHAAAALARRGCRVTVLERAAIAGGASGNPQGVLFTRLSHQRAALGEFSALAFLYAQSLYRQMFARGDLRQGVDGELNGCLQHIPANSESDALVSALTGLSDFARPLAAEHTPAVLGTQTAGGFWQPGSGWLSPPAVCKALLTHPLITLREHCGTIAVTRNDDSGDWELRTAHDKTLAAAPVLVVAAGISSRELLADNALPLRPVRGQTTFVPPPPGPALQSSLCHKGYVSPASAGMHCIGATFAPGDEGRELRVEDHAENLRRLADALPDWADYLRSLDPATLSGRAELRCVSPDYLPLAGPVADREPFLHNYASLGADARRVVPHRGSFHEGLYLSTAHGSRGLAYAALSAELIASQLFAEPAPMSRELQRAIAPSRFLIRNLIRGKASMPSTDSAGA
jgi:tRNA 5-methylaminomethyl-2-thiouridine biosynthesis bifunctional protein